MANSKPLTPLIELGSYFPSGVRTGPGYSSFNPSDTFVARNNAASTVRNMLYYNGPGMLQGALCTYRINPCDPANGAMSNATSMVRDTSIQLIATATDQRPTQYFISAGGLPAIQLDVPRAIRATVTGISGASTGETTITVRVNGIDVYGQRLTSDVTVTLDAGATTASVETPSCFYQVIGNPVVTAVNIGAGAGASGVVTLSAGARLGLPFRLYQPGHIIGYSQSTSGDVGIFPVTAGIEYSQLNVEPVGTPPSALQSYTVAAPILLTAGFDNYAGGGVEPTSFDVRGSFLPNTEVTMVEDGTQAAGNPFLWSGPITITYYVAGADFLAQENAQRLLIIKNSVVAQNTPALNDPWLGFGRTLYNHVPLAGTTNQWYKNPTAEPDLDMLIGYVPYFAA